MISSKQKLINITFSCLAIKDGSKNPLADGLEVLTDSGKFSATYQDAVKIVEESIEQIRAVLEVESDEEKICEWLLEKIDT